MDLDTDNSVLQALAAGQSMDIEQWPGLLSRLIVRLEKIVLNDFPRPTIQVSSSPRAGYPSSTCCEPEIQPSTKDVTAESNAIGALPSVLRMLLDSITDTLFSYFSQAPPHTIQRLAELLLMPRAHYRTLPSYLHALDRVVHVTSPATLFPLPPAIADPCAIALLSNGGGPVGGIDPLSVTWGNSVCTTSGISSVGSDEALGGALLTPITWIRQTRSCSPLEGEVVTQSSREFVEGPNGPVGVETVSISINGVSSATSAHNTGAEDSSSYVRVEGEITQSEPLHQEQELGAVPTTQISCSESNPTIDEEVPHAGGPKYIGVEDLGPQMKVKPKENGQSVGVETEEGKTTPNDGAKVREDNSSGEPKTQIDLNEEISPQKNIEDNTVVSQKREASDFLISELSKRGKHDINQTDPNNENTNEKNISTDSLSIDNNDINIANPPR